MLNESQQKAYKEIRNFLLNPDQKYFTISAPAGNGKTYLLNHIEKEFNSLNNQRKFLQMDSLQGIKFACSTNKAASLLESSSTVHKLLNLRLFTCYKTGETNSASTGKTQDLGRNLIVIDEASMLNEQLIKQLDGYTSSAKVIFVGDEFQLAPVGVTEVPAFSMGVSKATLDIPMRQDKDSHLLKELTKLRNAVKNKENYSIAEGEGITLMNSNDFKQSILTSFKNKEDARVLAYTNIQVEQYNKYIRKKLHGTTEFYPGDIVVAASAYGGKAKIEKAYQISDISSNQVTFTTGETFSIPVDKTAWFTEIKKETALANKSRDWSKVIDLKENYLDIRSGFSCTVNKSQGSTYNKVFIDLSNLLTCRNPDTLRRLIYVACSRSRKEVIIYKG